MALKLMYITNRPEVAHIAEESGVDRIFVDMEYIGKADRQGGMDTVQSHHTFEDIKNIVQAVEKAEVLVRVNPIHEKTEEYISSREEIDRAIACGAEILMLPYFKTVREVETFSKIVDGRVKTMLLVETPEAVEQIDEILKVKGIDEMFVGLNDLSLGYGLDFMFELLVDGTVEKLCSKFSEKDIPYGFGGIASIGKGLLPAENIITEHYRLGSTAVILSRSFCNIELMQDIKEVRRIFMEGVKKIRECEEIAQKHRDFFVENVETIEEKVAEILEKKH